MATVEQTRSFATCNTCEMQASDPGEPVRDMVMDATRALVGVAARSLAAVHDDVSLAQYRVLVLLAGRGPQTMGELAQSLDVSPSTVTRVCDVLVEKKLIRRYALKDDRRTTCATLAYRGRKIVDYVMQQRAQLIDDALQRMTPESQRRLALGLAEFAEAAGEVSTQAWTLGWSLAEEPHLEAQA